MISIRRRQRKPKISTLARLGINPYFAAVRFDHAAGDSQSQAHAFFAAGRPGRQPGKTLKQVLPVFGC